MELAEWLEKGDTTWKIPGKIPPVCRAGHKLLQCKGRREVVACRAVASPAGRA